MRDVVVIFAVLCAGLGVKQVIAGDEFEGLFTRLVGGDKVALGETYHGGHAPNIGTGAPFAAQDDFWGSILSRLDVVCEVVPDPTGVSEISNLH